MSRKIFLILFALILILSLGACSSGDQNGESGAEENTDNTNADVVEVQIIGFKFDPEVVTVTAGMTVTWTNYDAAPHSAVGDNDEWDSGAMRKNDTFSFTFDTPGTYAYHDYYYPAMHGTVEVTQ